ncbi:hypothetical protein ACFC0S_15710 [Streptomyces sp. NPDC056084]|uniref:hypothetical protein n=1 Tax=unclassified Streptomyces TaxID=2593676 RepID=UPI0035DF1C56
MNHQEAALDDIDETPEVPDAVRKIQDALRALHIDPDFGGAYERPAIAAGYLLAAAEILARRATSTPGDPDGAEQLGDVMHGFYGMVVALAPDTEWGPSALRGELLQDRLRRCEKQAELLHEDGDPIAAALEDAIAETGRLRRQSGNVL